MDSIELEMDDERRRTLAGLMILEAVDDSDAWALFWRAVTVARTSFHSRPGPGAPDAERG